MSTTGATPPSPAAPTTPGAAPAKKSYLWLWIVLGLVACMGIGIVLLAAGGAIFFARRVGTGLQEAQRMTAHQQIESFQAALALYESDCGSYPTTAQGLDSLVHDPGSCRGWKPYLAEGEVPKDPWGRAYQYSSPGTRGHDLEIVSLGADGQLGTEDDVTSW